MGIMKVTIITTNMIMMENIIMVMKNSKYMTNGPKDTTLVIHTVMKMPFTTMMENIIMMNTIWVWTKKTIIIMMNTIWVWTKKTIIIMMIMIIKTKKVMNTISSMIPA